MEKVVILEDVDRARNVFGVQDKHLRQIEKELEIEIFARGTTLTLRGEQNTCQKAQNLLEELYELTNSGMQLSSRDIEQALLIAQKDANQKVTDVFLDSIGKTLTGKPITPRTLTQKKYVTQMRKHDIVFSWGPAGTGKTYLAMAMAVSALLNREVNRIILARPAVEAGEKLGFLPGDMAEKVNPYLRPLYDALYEMLETEKANHYLSRNQIEVAPLAFMRGRTLNHSFVILDEAQNTSPEQMKMFLTRLGHNSRSVITGDITQVDLPQGCESGLIHAIKLLRNTEGIGFTEFSEKDVVRHELVRKIILAYEREQHAR